MKTTKQLLVVTLFTLFSVSVYSQSHQHEVGFRMASLDRFDFVYKKAKSNNKFLRMRLIDFNLSLLDGERGAFSFGLGMAVGLEKRKTINEEFSFIHGFEPRLSFRHANAQEIPGVLDVSFGIGYVLGFQYDLSNKIYLSIESIPSLSINYSQRGSELSYTRASLGVSPNLIALSAVYKFSKQK